MQISFSPLEIAEMKAELATATGTRKEALKFLLSSAAPRNEVERQESPDGYGPLDQHKA